MLTDALLSLSFQPPEVGIEEESWYYGSVDRKEAEGKCRSTGDYLVRFSDRQNKYVLSVHWNNAGRHFVIQEVPDVSHTHKPRPQPHPQIAPNTTGCFDGRHSNADFVFAPFSFLAEQAGLHALPF